MRQLLKKNNIFLAYFALVLVTLIAFEQVRLNDFVSYDDNDYVTENPQVLDGLTQESVIWAFTTPYAYNWHPLTWLSHMLDCELFELNPSRHHLTSLLFHMANTLLLFWALQKMTGMALQSLFVAALFAVHPLHVESVAWIAERKDVLSGFFWMSTIAAYACYAARPCIRKYLLVALFLALGLMSKPMMVTLPFVLLLLDYWPLCRIRFGDHDAETASPDFGISDTGYNRVPISSLIIEKIPLFVLAVSSSIITFIVQQGAGAVVPRELIPMNHRIATALISYVSYIVKMICPSGLAVFYPHPYLYFQSSQSPSFWQPVMCLTVLAIISGVIICAFRQRRYLIVGWMWYIGTLVPVIGLVQVGNQAMADRYTYLPSIGIFIMIVWGMGELLAKWRYRKIVIGISAGLILITLLVCTRMQVRNWKNSVTLYERALKVTQNNYVMHYNLGTELAKQGKFDGAIDNYHKALRIYSDYYEAHNNLGAAFASKGEFNEAINHYLKALKIDPYYYEAHNNFGIALASQGRFEQAINHYRQALQIYPEYTDAYCNLGNVLFQQSRLNEAIQCWTNAVQLNPGRHDAYNNLAIAFYKQGRLNEAIKYWSQTVRLDPGNLKALNILRTARTQLNNTEDAVKHFGLGMSLAKQDKLNEAVDQYTKALQLKPDWVAAYNNLAWILATTNDKDLRNPDEAVRLARKACELTKFERPDILDTMSVAYAAVGRFAEAVEAAEKALELARAAKNEKLADEIRGHLKLYQNQQSYPPLKLSPATDELQADQKNLTN